MEGVVQHKTVLALLSETTVQLDDARVAEFPQNFRFVEDLVEPEGLNPGLIMAGTYVLNLEHFDRIDIEPVTVLEVGSEDLRVCPFTD